MTDAGLLTENDGEGPGEVAPAQLPDGANLAKPPAGVSRPTADWTFLTNHAHVLIALSRQPDLRVRDVATAVGITERAVQRIVGDLELAGLLTRVKEGRRNSYHLRVDYPLRHPLEANCTVSALLEMANRNVD